jgi:hypothetical protein
MFEGEDRPRCIGCDEDLAVRHIFLDCVDVATQCAGFYASLLHLRMFEIGNLCSAYKDAGLYLMLSDICRMQTLTG